MLYSPTELHAVMLTGLFGNFFFIFLKFYSHDITKSLVLQTLFIPCDPLSTESLLGVLPTSWEERKKKRDKIACLKKKTVEVFIYNTWVKNLEIWPKPKVSEGWYQMLLFWDGLKIRQIEKWTRCLISYGRKQGTQWERGSVRLGSGLGQFHCWTGQGLPRGISSSSSCYFFFLWSSSHLYCGMWDVNIFL